MKWTFRHLVACLALLGCEQERRAPIVPDVVAPTVVPWQLPEVEPLVGETATNDATVGETQRHPDCWEFLEATGIVLPEFPLPDRTEAAAHLASCGVEATATLPDGARVLAWGGAPAEGSDARDLRIAVWEPSGTLRWSAALDRTRQAPNWNANFRRSFITLLDDVLCAGTMWEGDTQLTCRQQTDGTPIFTGSLPLWSGIPPQRNQGGLVVADISAITQRYLFSGAEMRHKKLESLGGRAGYYATDGRRLYFAPSRVDAPPLVAYDLETFEEVWRTPLPSLPSSSVAHAWTRFNRVLLEVDDTLVALDTETGAVAWAYEVTEDIGSITADSDTIYVLARRPEVPNRLTALDPATGERRWSLDTPSGTLRALVADGHLFIGSIRAVQHVIPPDATDE